MIAEYHQETSLTKPSMTFFSLQGLGNSIMNFPLLANLREHYQVRVVAYNNGSSAFFGAFHRDVIGVSTNTDFLKKTFKLSSNKSFVCYPTWKRELSAVLLNRVEQRYFVSPQGIANWVWPTQIRADRSIHNLENNIRLLRMVHHIESVDLDFRAQLKLPFGEKKRTLAIHPTASSVCKYYPVEFWEILLRQIQSDFDELLIFCGAGAEEIKHCHAISYACESELEKRIRICSDLDFRNLALHIGSASQFIGVDSALMHLSALLDRPTVGLWSFANFRVIYPYGNHVSVYIPSETLDATTYEYSKTAPIYVKRADPAAVAKIVQGKSQPNFEIKPSFKKPVAFFKY